MGHFSLNFPPRTLPLLALLAGAIGASPAEGKEPFTKLDTLLAGIGSASADLEVAMACEEAGPKAQGGGGLCDDLYRFSCAPGDWADGTGVAGNDDPVQRRVAALKAGLAKKATKEFAAKIAAPDGAYLRKMALSAYGLSNAPGCDAPKPNSHCHQILAEALGAQVSKNLFPRRSAGDESRGPRPASLRGLDLLQQNAVYRNLEKRFSREAKLALKDENTEKKIAEKIFPRVQKLLGELIRRKVPDPKIREILTTKIAGISFDGVDCAAPVPPDATGESYDPSLSAMLEPNAYYTPARNGFRFCNGFLLRNKSEFQIASVVAHELAHSIDPCLITHGPHDFRFDYSEPMNRERSEAQFPLPNLLACLRSPGSVQAEFKAGLSLSQGAPGSIEEADKIAALEKRIASLNEQILKPENSREIRETLRDEKTIALAELTRARRQAAPPGAMPPGPDFGGPPPPENAFCDQDQIGESFADWVAGEILPTYIKEAHPRLSSAQAQIGFANVFRGTCREQAILPEGPHHFDEHPESYRRANFILLAQPEVRRQMGCPLDPPEGVSYCDVPDVKGDR